jgi:hypothetical protein
MGWLETSRPGAGPAKTVRAVRSRCTRGPQSSPLRCLTDDSRTCTSTSWVLSPRQIPATLTCHDGGQIYALGGGHPSEVHLSQQLCGGPFLRLGDPLRGPVITDLGQGNPVPFRGLGQYVRYSGHPPQDDDCLPPPGKRFSRMIS